MSKGTNNTVELPGAKTDAYAGSQLSYYYRLLLRAYFILFPINALVVKIVGFDGITYWKDATCVFCFLLGIVYLIKVKQTAIYLVLVILTIPLNLIHGSVYFEYLSWFLSGIPAFLYFKLIKPDEFIIDCYIILSLMIAGALWVFLLERHGGYEYFFTKEQEGTTLVRGEGVRVRWLFVSPMAFSQYSWFVALLLFFNKNLNKTFKYIAYTAVIYVLAANDTRAGLLLMGFSVILYGIFSFIKFNKLLTTGFVLAAVTAIIYMVVASAAKFDPTDQTGTSASDLERLLYILDGVQKSTNNLLTGMGGAYFSSRSSTWLDCENAWLPFIACFGLVGIGFVVLFTYIYLFKSNSKVVLMFSIPWFIYAFVFPSFQEATAILISWFIIAAVLNEHQTNCLLNYPGYSKRDKTTTQHQIILDAE